MHFELGYLQDHRDGTPAGKVKVLDFGLAKAFTPETSPDHASQLSTVTAEATLPGVILGTAAYMSPERTRGTTVDRRSDIWAFGCCVYEILTGQAAFHGGTLSDMIAAVIERTYRCFESTRTGQCARRAQ